MVVNENLDLRGTMVMWAIILLEIPTLTLLTVLYFTGNLGEDGWKVILFVAVIMIAAFTLLMNLRLRLRIDPYGLAFQNPPFLNRWKKISIPEIQSIEVKKSDGMLEYGGVGVRFSRKTTAYLFYTDHILIVQTAKKKYVFSTKKPQEVEAIIQSWKVSQSD
ncbi:hypothetical protein BC751_4006 [Cecembia calidifontis]|jgi:hypothetical protein|uniref:PH (Pleckstrin Homology) domain-containing protein n=2 Tax=Cecembia calidifontis TaxID=1187080 RepID=A0A4V2F727_9BACT|nr:hypothetical protein BC751_4006 [Cecembia calidifontis]